jgi:transcriptional regulator with XRE-family HTH domain
MLWEAATGGVVTRSYFTNLRKGRIENPGYEKMRAIARAMCFAPEAWFEEGVGREPDRPEDEGRGISGKVEHLFDAVRNPKTGEPYTNAEVARMTLGDLSEDDIEGIRTGAVGDPTVGQVVALAGVFGVEPSYLLDRDETVREKMRASGTWFAPFFRGFVPGGLTPHERSTRGASRPRRTRVLDPEYLLLLRFELVVGEDALIPKLGEPFELHLGLPPARSAGSRHKPHGLGHVRLLQRPGRRRAPTSATGG